MRRLTWAHIFVAVVVVAGLGGWIYGKAVELIEGRRAGELPVVAPLPEPIRERPEDPGGYTPEHLDVRVLDQPRDGAPENEGEGLPEVPDVAAPPPAAEPAPVAVPDGAPDPAPAAAPENVTAPVVPASPPASAADAPPETGAAGADDGERAAPVPPSRQGEPPVRAAGAGEGTLALQLASFYSQGAAEREWLRLRRAHRDVLGPLGVRISRVDQGGGQVLYRLRTGPFANRKAAEDACAALKAAGADCFVADWR